MMMIYDRSHPVAANGFKSQHAAIISSCYARLTKRNLLGESHEPASIGHALYHAPFVVLAHDTSNDPIFFYANIAAQKLFQLSWGAFMALPSRMSAETMARQERQALLDRVAQHGFIDDYCGVRIADDGHLFQIEGACVWNLHDGSGKHFGQAAAFDKWHRL